MKSLFSLLTLIFCFVLISCGGDDGPGDCADLSVNFTSEFSDELQGISSTGAAFANDPSASNCEAYKDAVRDYIDALESFEDCAREAGALAEWNQALNEYDENLINSLC